MISSPHCAVSGFVFVFVLNLLICYTSVIAYMKFLSPPLRVVTFTNARCAATSVWNNVEVLLLVIIVWQGYLALIMKKKVSLPHNFYLVCVYIPSCEAHKHCRAEIAQYKLEIIFKITLKTEFAMNLDAFFAAIFNIDAKRQIFENALQSSFPVCLATFTMI